MAETSEVQTPEQVIETTPHKEPPTAGDTADAYFRKGINKERKRREERFITDLARYGVEPIRDAKGKLDEAASIDALVRAGQPSAAKELEARYAGRISELTNENQRLQTELQRTRISTTVRENIAQHNPTNINDATDLFLLRYNIKPDEDTGELIVCDNAGNVLHHKITAEPLKVSDAVDQFFQERPGLLNQSKGNGLQGLGAMKGSPRTTTNNDLSTQYIDALNSGDKQKAQQIKMEMNKRVRTGLSE